MAEFPAMQLWTDAYLADTRHLSATEHGAYLLLLMMHWRTGEEGLPDDDKLLARYASMTLDKWRRIAPTVRAFFRAQNGRLVQARVQDELQHLRAQREKSSAGGKAKALKNNNRNSARSLPKPCLTPAPTTTPTSVDKSTAAEAASNPHDPVKELFDLGVAILVETGTEEKRARSLIGQWRKGGKEDAKVLQALLECRSKSVSEPIEWLQQRLRGAKYVSANGYEYRGSLEAIMREAEKRADWGTYWTVNKELKQGAAQ